VRNHWIQLGDWLFDYWGSS